MSSCACSGLARGLGGNRVVGSKLVLDFFSNSDLKDDTGFCQECIQQSFFRYILALLTMEAASVPSSMVKILTTTFVPSLTPMQRQDKLLVSG